MINYFQFVVWMSIGSVVYATNYFETYFHEPQVKQNSRNAIKIDKYKWPGGLVHYEFDYTYCEDDRNAVLSAMELIMEKTCVKFEKKQTIHKEHIKFLKVT